MEEGGKDGGREREAGGMQSAGMLEGGMERRRTEEEEEEGGRKDGMEGETNGELGAGARKKKTKQSGQIRFGVEGSEQSDYSN